MNLHTKKGIADSKRVTTRTVENWLKRGLLPSPIKLGNTLQSRVRWTDADVAVLDRNLSQLSATVTADESIQRP